MSESFTAIRALISLGLLCAFIVGLIRLSIISAYTWRQDEMDALLLVAKAANLTVGNDDPRKYWLGVLHTRLNPLNAGIAILITPDETTAIAPFVDAWIQNTGTKPEVRESLTRFKARLVRRDRWPTKIA